MPPGTPIVLSIVSCATELHALKFPEAKSSAKIGGVAPPETTIGAEAGLRALGPLPSESSASTV